MQLLRRHQREALAQVEAHLVAEHAAGAGAGAVALRHAMLVHMAHEVFVLGADRAGGGHARLSTRTAPCGCRSSKPWSGAPSARDLERLDRCREPTPLRCSESGACLQGLDDRSDCRSLRSDTLRQVRCTRARCARWPRLLRCSALGKRACRLPSSPSAWTGARDRRVRTVCAAGFHPPGSPARSRRSGAQLACMSKAPSTAVIGGRPCEARASCAHIRSMLGAVSEENDAEVFDVDRDPAQGSPAAARPDRRGRTRRALDSQLAIPMPNYAMLSSPSNCSAASCA